MFNRRNFVLTVAAGSLSARYAKSDAFGKMPINGSPDSSTRDFDVQQMAVKTQPDMVIFEGGEGGGRGGRCMLVDLQSASCLLSPLLRALRVILPCVN